MAVTGGDEHALSKPGGEPRGHGGEHGAPGALHQRSLLGAGGDGLAIPGGGLVRGEYREHGLRWTVSP
jgi:hypothetical protein